MWLFILFRTFSLFKEQRNFYRFWHIFCYKVSWVDHTARSCKQKAQASILCILVTIWYGQNSKREKKTPQTKQKKSPQGNHPPQGYERWQEAVCMPMCRSHCWQRYWGMVEGTNIIHLHFYTSQEQPETLSKKKKYDKLSSNSTIPRLLFSQPGYVLVLYQAILKFYIPCFRKETQKNAIKHLNNILERAVFAHTISLLKILTSSPI